MVAQTVLTVEHPVGVFARPTRMEVRLLGRIEIVVDGRPVPLAGRHAQALAALLALTRRHGPATPSRPTCGPMR